MKILMVYPSRPLLDRARMHLLGGRDTVVLDHSHGVGLVRIRTDAGEVSMVVINTTESMRSLMGTQWDLIVEDSEFRTGRYGPIHLQDWDLFKKVSLARR